MTEQQTAGLSERELDILRLVATGASNKEIAQRLYISSNTVKVHLRNIFAKIGATSRTEAAMYAVSLGMVPQLVPEENSGSTSQQTSEVALVSADSGQFISGTEQPPEQLKTARYNQFSMIFVLFGSILLLGLVGFGLYLRSSANNPPPASPAISTSSPQWKSLAALPTPRSGLALAGYENQIYAIAGEANNGVTSVVEKYDPSSDLWHMTASKPTAVSDIQAGVIGGKIYVPGGRLSSGEVTNIVEVYDPRQNNWSEGVSMPVALSAYALVSYEGKLYLFGGWDGKRFVNTVYAFDPELGQWDVKTPMPTARGFAGSATAGGKIYVLGGFDGRQALTANEVYLPDRDNNQENPWSQAKPLPNGRFGIGVSSVADLVYVLGGTDNNNQNLTPMIYYPQNDNWASFVAPQEEVGSKLGLVTLGSYLYSMGGKLSDVPANHNLAYQAIYTVSIPVIIK